MEKNVLHIDGFHIDVYSLNTVIVGTGAAGLNAADSLYCLGQKDIAIVTQGLNMGTSRNTGSDKQTYYKITLAGECQDSVIEMAKTYFSGGCMNGDIALIEAALSARSFYKLVDIGVPFPHNKYGEYVGYKTDHDPRQRATSAGPLTSRFMVEKLQKKVDGNGMKIFDGYQVIAIITGKESRTGEKRSIGLISLNLNELDRPNMGMTLFNCTNIIYATGGPAGIYHTSVYPESQTGASGIAFEAGARGVNLTESQYGIASTKFRWNLSGTYQQVMPRYISTDQNGNCEREFLNEYFDKPGRMLDAIFLKGYQWPFDPRKVKNYGSSLIDILVYYEIQMKGRRVFLDFTKNPRFGSVNGELDFSLLGRESYNYLKNSDALFGTPIQRLARMNQPAIDLYKNNGIDMANEYLEIAVCAQHNNGGLAGNIWWESNIRHFFPVGEVNGSFGVYRPGGAALNSTQVGSLRAAQYISANYNDPPLDMEDFIRLANRQVSEKIDLASAFKANLAGSSNVYELRKTAQLRMTKYGAHIRSSESIRDCIEKCANELNNLAKDIKIASVGELPDAFINRDILITQFVYFNAILKYIEKGGKSRGSYIIQDSKGEPPTDKLADDFKFKLDDGELSNQVCEVEYIAKNDNFYCEYEWKPVRPIPSSDNWFENVWKDYRSNRIIV